MVVSIKTPWFY